ncbi:hypothetical protein PG987_005168 [Apiospora arundinis]
MAQKLQLLIMIDGIDSIEKREQHLLITALEEVRSKAKNVVKIFVASRTHDWTLTSISPARQVRITTDETKKDMVAFVEQTVKAAVAKRLLLAGNVSEHHHSLIAQTLIDGAGEMFIWVKLQIECLCRETHVGAVLDRLQGGLPETLEQLYQQTLDYIFQKGEESREIAVRVFSWILYTKETLTSTALLAALSVAERDETSSLAQVIAGCENLIILDNKRDVICFMHQSLREFLVQKKSFAAAAANRLISSACIETATRGLPSEENLGSARNDFGVYAAMYWPVHAKLAEETNPAEVLNAKNPTLDKLTTFIFDEDFDTTLSFDSWLRNVRRIGSDLARDHTMKPAFGAIPIRDSGFLFLLSIFGLNDLLSLVLSNVSDIDLNITNDLGNTPVYLAATLGHTRAVSMLVDHGANIDAVCGRHGSALHAACFEGHLEVVETLLKLQVNSTCGGVYQDALQAAFQGGQENVVLFLIDQAGMITSEDDYDRALEGAAHSGFFSIVKALQAPRFGPLRMDQSKPDKVKKKIRRAIEGGQLNILREFMGTQAHVKDVLPPDSVSLATLYQHQDMVEFLLSQNSSIEAESTFGTPLRTAALLSSESLIHLLLERGAKVNGHGQFGDALQVAAMKGHTSVMKLLMDEGANVNQQTGFYGTALQAAAYHGHEDAVGILLDAGADIFAPGYTRDAFHAAAKGGHQNIIVMMLQKGYRFHTKYQPSHREYKKVIPSACETLLRSASPGRQERKSRIGKRMNTRRKRAISNLETIFGMASDDSNIPDLGNKKTPTGARRLETRWVPRTRGLYDPLGAAASAGHEETVKLLLEQKEALHIRAEELRNAIVAASSNGHLGVVQAILVDISRLQPLQSYIKMILKTGRREHQAQVVQLALTLAVEHCSPEEAVRWRNKYSPTDTKPPERPMSKEQIVADFKKACRARDSKLLGTILESKYHEALPQEEIDAMLQLCIMRGDISLVKIFIGSLVAKRRFEFSLEEAFVTAAARGSKDLMELFQPHMTQMLDRPDYDAITRSLAVSSENGHIEIVRYLVKDLSANVNIHALDKFVGPNLSERTGYVSRDSLFAIRMRDIRTSYSTSSSEEGSEEHIGAVFISPLQAALQGLARFGAWEEDHPSLLPHPLRRYHERQACQSDQQEVFRFLLQRGANPDDLGGQDSYPIHFAAKWCPLEAVEELISAGADVNLESGEDGTALFAAAGRELSSAPAVEKLLAAGAVIPEGYAYGTKLLKQALHYFGRYSEWSSEAPSMEYVFREGPGAVLFNLLTRMPHMEIETTDEGEWPMALQMAVILDCHPYIDLLLSRGADVNAEEHNHYGSALQTAARFGHVQMVRKLLDAGARVNIVAGHQWGTPLRAAIAGGHETVVRILLSHGADRNLGIVKALLENGVDAIHGTPGAPHPLIMASQLESSEVAKELLDAGAPPNVISPEDEFGDDLEGFPEGEDIPRPRFWGRRWSIEEASPIHAAISYGCLDVVKLLVARGAEIELAIKHKPKPLCAAAAKGNVKIVRFLVSAGATVDDSKALWEAVRNGDIEAVQELVRAGSNASLVFKQACRMKNLEILELLVESVYKGEEPQMVIADAFDTPGIVESSFQFLLGHASPTQIGFSRACAEGLITSVTYMLDMGDVDIDSPDINGDYPLQVAAASLQPAIVSLLLSHGAQVDCLHPRSGTPLELVLEECAKPILPRKINPNHLVRWKETLYRPTTIGANHEYITQSHYDYDGSSDEDAVFYGNEEDEISDDNTTDFSGDGKSSEDDKNYVDSESRYHGSSAYTEFSSFANNQRILCCERIMQILVVQGADICNNNSRPYGRPLHLASGSDVHKVSDDYFQSAVFAAIEGDHPDVVALLVKNDPSCIQQIHSEHGTPLHLACALDNGACARKLLELGADSTAPNSQGQTPLTVYFEQSKSPRYHPMRASRRSTVLQAFLSTAKYLRLSEDDLLAALEVHSRGRNGIITSMLALDTEMVVSERVICRAIETGTSVEDILDVLIPRAGGISVTTNMLKACRDNRIRKALLKYGKVEWNASDITGQRSPSPPLSFVSASSSQEEYFDRGEFLVTQLR